MTSVRMLGPYELLERIGHGATGRVWRARHTTAGTNVAIKVLREELADDPAVRARFIQEGALLAGRALPGVIEVLETVVDGENVGLVMRLVVGQNLRQVMSADAPLRPARACALAAQVASGLAAAHQAGLVHRDVKPENVLVDASAGGGRTYLTDFGLARALDRTTTSGTRSGAFGTPHYSAPERFGPESVGPPADVYALGVLLFEMLVGWRPFRSADPVQVMVEHREQPPMRPAGLHNDDLWELIEKSLAKNALDRPTAEDMSHRLDSLAKTLRDTPPLPNTDPPSNQLPTHIREPSNGAAPAASPDRSKHRRLWIAAAAIGLVAIGGAAVATTGQHRLFANPGEAGSQSASPREADPAESSTQASTVTVPEPATSPSQSRTASGADATTAAKHSPESNRTSQRTSLPTSSSPPPQVRETKEPVPPKPPTIVTRSLPDGTVGRTYRGQLRATGDGPFTWRLAGGRLPAGFVLSSTGLISGGPVSGRGNTVFTVRAATQGGLATTRSLTISLVRLRSDINSDGEVDCQDLATLKQHFFEEGGFGDGDINGDGTVNALDLSMMMSDWTGSTSDC